ncbi:MAG: hypothetical protein RLZZ611_2256 [Cyanobacteriota bacterium]|jgi:proteasome lid subunit RPN8/RPN11
MAASPQEGCALLLGKRQGSALVLEQIWPCCNSWEPAAERQRHFLLDPREQLLAQRWARDRQLQVLGAAHSHPSSAAVPSTSDLRLCCGPTLMLIRTGLINADQPISGPPTDDSDDAALIRPLRAWWLPDGAGWDAGTPLQSAEALAEPRELRIALRVC